MNIPSEFCANASLDLKTLHRSGWTHCDISVGNVLITATGAKLTDVEYARSLDKPEPYDMIVSVAYPMLEIMFIPVREPRTSNPSRSA